MKGVEINFYITTEFTESDTYNIIDDEFYILVGKMQQVVTHQLSVAAVDDTFVLIAIPMRHVATSEIVISPFVNEILIQ